MLSNNALSFSDHGHWQSMIREDVPHEQLHYMLRIDILPDKNEVSLLTKPLIHGLDKSSHVLVLERLKTKHIAMLSQGPS